MLLTVSELAITVGKSENYIRQHIHRKHLAVVRQGRKVFVEQDEAARWAKGRGLPLTLPGHAFAEIRDSDSDSAARITVLALHSKDNKPLNLFTHIRSRRREALGPWAKEPSENWTSEVVSTEGVKEIWLHSIDTSLGKCRELVDIVLSDGVLTIDEHEVQYALEQNPLRHWAYRDQHSQSETSIRSPFSKHSAEMTEYWSFAEAPQGYWQQLVYSGDAMSKRLESTLNRLMFPLDQYLERVGNLLISRAEDEVVCQLSAHHRKMLILEVERIDGADLLPDAYTATVWANHSDNEVLLRKLSINQGKIVVHIDSDVDRIGFALYRNIDGQCIDFMDVHLVMSISIDMNIDSGTNVNLYDPNSQTEHQLSLGTSRSVIEVEADKNSALLYKEIRQRTLARKVLEREARARSEGNLARFGPDEFDEAVEYFLGLLRRYGHDKEPIYLADRYFADPKFRSRGSAKIYSHLYVQMFAETQGRPLRILCGQKNASAWWKGLNFITKHLTARSFVTQKDGHVSPAFHDRYLISGDREILISNSLNNWNDDGVTFVSLPYGVYRAETERLWSMEVGKTTEGVQVYEVSW